MNIDIIKIHHASMLASSRLHQDILQDTESWQNVAMLVAFTDFELSILAFCFVLHIWACPGHPYSYL